MMKRLLILLSLFAVACGGSSNHTGEGVERSGFSGILSVPDGYLVTKVCFDKNSNKMCDEGEPNSSDITTDNFFIIKGTNDDAKSNLIAEISTNTPNSNKLVLESVAGKMSDSKFVISSITTMVKNRMDSQGESLEDAELKVATDLGVSSSDLYSSAIETKADAVFKIIVTILDSVGIEFSSGLMTLIYEEISTQLHKIGTDNAQDIIDNAGTNITPDKVNKTDVAFKHFIGTSAYMFHYNPKDGPNFCMYEFHTYAIMGYCNGGDKDDNGKLILPTSENHTDREPMHYTTTDDGSLYLFGPDITYHKYTEKDATNGLKLKSSQKYNNKEITFSPNAIIYKVNGIAVDSEDAPFYINGDFYMFNEEAANDIRNQWE